MKRKLRLIAKKISFVKAIEKNSFKKPKTTLAPLLAAFPFVKMSFHREILNV